MGKKGKSRSGGGDTWNGHDLPVAFGVSGHDLVSAEGNTYDLHKLVSSFTNHGGGAMLKPSFENFN